MEPLSYKKNGKKLSYILQITFLNIEWNINIANNSYLNYNMDSYINLQTDENMMPKQDLEEVKENYKAHY